VLIGSVPKCKDSLIDQHLVESQSSAEVVKALKTKPRGWSRALNITYFKFYNGDLNTKLVWIFNGSFKLELGI
jgi:hypothetical protein